MELAPIFPSENRVDEVNAVTNDKRAAADFLNKIVFSCTKIREPQWQGRTFAAAFEMQRRVWAAAQQRPSKLASAFALHHNCSVNMREKNCAQVREKDFPS